MSRSSIAVEPGQSSEPMDKYFSFEIRGWTNFDPRNESLSAIAAGIEKSNGFLTSVEVLKAVGLASIEDEQARECFANTLAAKRVMQNIQELPQKLVDELRSALSSAEGIDPRQAISPNNQAPSPSARVWL